MLRYLSIQNIVLIDRSNINFGNSSFGLCVLTGETGSGKSILLDSIGLVLGFKANQRLIGSADNKALVLAEFDISDNPKCYEFLKEQELLNNDDEFLLIIRRSISETQSSKAFVNDIPISINLLTNIGEYLIEINGQHDQRGLLNPTFHLSILDEFAQNQSLGKDLKKIHKEISYLQKIIDEANAKQDNIRREAEYLQHAIKELEDAKIQQDEEIELINRKNQFANKDKLVSIFNDFNNKIIEANSALINSHRILTRNQNHLLNFFLNDQSFLDECDKQLDSYISWLDSTQTKLDRTIKSLQSGARNLDEIEERLLSIRSISRKFNVSSNELGRVLLEYKTKVNELTLEESEYPKLQAQMKNLLTQYHQIAVHLSQKRKEAAAQLSQKVKHELTFLKMPNAQFLVKFLDEEQKTVTSNGYDKIRFCAAINNNQFDDISKVASGGELSRFMLALKVALLGVKSVPTIIFDEIDAGIGGSTASAVGKRLKDLSSKLQVMVVTHQPQIACLADLHFKVSKEKDEQNLVKTKVEELDLEGKKMEIARMLSGEEITKEAIAAAEKLIEFK